MLEELDPFVEAVPNFSEGRDRRVIDTIAGALDGGGARVLHIDPNGDANRSVITLGGRLSSVTAALHRGVGAAVSHIDMRRQQGAHIRVGAADVLPIVLLEPGVQARGRCLEAISALGDRLAEDYELPIFLYEDSARRRPFRSLPRCRRGGYDALDSRFAAGLATGSDGPDLGPKLWSDQVARTGATVLGLRSLLVAMNFTLDSSDQQLAASVAAAVRSSGPAGRPHALPSVRAVGWTMAGYGGRVQVSVNLLDIDESPAHRVLEVLQELSGGLVLGGELIGLAPARVFRDAGLVKRGDVPVPMADDGVLNPAAAADWELVCDGAELLGFGHLDAWKPGEELRARILELRLAAVGMLPEYSD